MRPRTARDGGSEAWNAREGSGCEDATLELEIEERGKDGTARPSEVQLVEHLHGDFPPGGPRDPAHRRKDGYWQTERGFWVCQQPDLTDQVKDLF